MVIDIELSRNTIVSVEGTHEAYMEPMVDLNSYRFSFLTTHNFISLECSFLNMWKKLCFQSEHLYISNRGECTIMDAKYKGSNINAVVNTQ